MEINITDSKRLVEVWLNNAEKADPAIREGLKGLCTKFKQKQYMVAVFESGSRDLYRSTLDLLTYNKRRCAELEVQREKRMSAGVVQ